MRLVPLGSFSCKPPSPLTHAVSPFSGERRVPPPFKTKLWVERLNSEVAEYQTRVWDALATFDWTDKAAGQWHPAESVMVNHAPVKCKVLYDDDKKTDVTEFALTITPLYYVP